MKLIAPKWTLGGGAAAAIVLAIAGVLGAHFEGTRYLAYQDQAGTWTICTGHTAGVKQNDVATPEQCEAWLRDEMAASYATVQRCITHDLTLGQAVAFTDATYNLGPSIVCGSTLQKLANAGDLEGACMQLVNAKGADGLPTGFTKAGGIVREGLIKRREAEVAVCLGGIR